MPTPDANLNSVPAWIQTAVTILGVLGTTLVGIYSFMRKKAHEESRTALENRDNSAILKKISEHLDKIVTCQERVVSLTERNTKIMDDIARHAQEEQESDRVSRLVDERLNRLRHHSTLAVTHEDEERSKLPTRDEEA